MPQYTVKQLLKRMPEPFRSMAKNYIAIGWDTYEYAYQMIDFEFSWHTTKEGLDFWHVVYLELKHKNL